MKTITDKKFKAEKQSGKWTATDEIEFPPKSVGQYDKKNNCTEWVLFQNDSTLLNYTMIGYDPKGILNSLTTYDATGKPNTHLDITKRDGKGEIINATYMSKDGDPNSHLMVEREQSRIKKMTTRYPDNDVEFSQSYLYDKDGNVTEMKINQAGNGQKDSFVYVVQYLEFDRFKNWTKKLELDVEKGQGAITVREIEYR